MKDIAPGPASASPSQMLAYNDQCYFVVYGGYGQPEIWKSDGTQQETIPITKYGTDQIDIERISSGVLRLRKFGYKSAIDIISPVEEQIEFTSKWQEEHGHI